MLDLESLEGMSLAEVTRWTGRWVDTVTRDLRRRGLVGKPIIYTPFDLGNGFGCLLWVARYSDDFRAPTIPKPWQRATIWQHSNGRYGPVKHVPGFGPVDVNAVHPDVPLSALRVKRVRRPADTPGPVPGATPTSRAGAAPVAEAVAPGAGGRAGPARAGTSRARACARSFRSPWPRPRSRTPCAVPEFPVPFPVPELPDPVALPALPTLPTLPTVPQPALAAAPDVQLMIDLAVARVQLETAAQQLAAALDRLPER